MQTNQELKNAWDFVEHTGVSIFLTGKAGTGKTTFLRALRQHSAKTMIVVAPTGVAAINAGGVTIHSFFQLPLSPFVPGAKQHDRYGFSRDKLKIVRALDLLVIDEISMVRADLLDAVDAALRKYRRSALPFGGVQLLMIGDLQQLAPVVTPADEAMLRPYYSSPYFFASRALERVPYVTIQLTQVFRQQNAQFVSLLNNVRAGRHTPADRAMLQSRLNPGFHPPADSGYIRLTTHNNSADDYNAMSLMRLPGLAHTYSAVIHGNFPEMSYPTAFSLKLKPGAQVMFIRNDYEGSRYYNGKIGRVTRLEEDTVYVLCPGEDVEIEVQPQEWENARYSVNPETNTVETTVDGTFSQLPLRLAWAVTIHKSQGLTFDHVVIDAGASFAPGQVYVALSRCRTLEGIVLATPINEASILPDSTVAGYIAHQDAAAAQSLAALPAIRNEYRRRLLGELFNFRDIADLQGSLLRLMTRELMHSAPAATSTQTIVADDLRAKVIDVADKWLSQLGAMPFEALASPTFLERVKGGCRYFADSLRGCLADPLIEAAQIQPGDKRVKQRYQSLLSDLMQAFRSRVNLLEDISENGFTIVNYLNFKQRATLGASDRVKSTKKREPRTKKSRAKADTGAKPGIGAGEKSRDITLQLLRQGMTPGEIAEERNLTRSSVSQHIRDLFAMGKVTLEEAFGPVVLNAARSALAQCSGHISLEKVIKMLDGYDLTPYDVRLIMQQLSPAE